MKQDNLWNRFFFKETLTEEKRKYLKFKKLLGLYPEFSERVINSKDLIQLLEIHKKMWESGFRNHNLGPCEYGMFRCESIPTMRSNQVFLGNIYGLFTHDIDYWETDKETEMGVNGFGIPRDTKIYDLLVKQYRKILLTNLNTIKHEANEYVDEYEEINGKENPYTLIS